MSGVVGICSKVPPSIISRWCDYLMRRTVPLLSRDKMRNSESGTRARGLAKLEPTWWCPFFFFSFLLVKVAVVLNTFRS